MGFLLLPEFEGELGWIQTHAQYTTGALLLGAPFVVTSYRL